MRDDSARWDEIADADFSANGVAIRPVTLQRQTMISGPDVLRQIDAPIVRWPGPVEAACYSLSLRTDRVLVVNGRETTEGWHEGTSQAVSDMTDAFAVFDISGERALELLSRGGELRPDTPSQSVARLLFGLDVFLYGHGTGGDLRIHVASGHAAALIKALKAAAARL
jgi:hypothetical protein